MSDGGEPPTGGEGGHGHDGDHAEHGAGYVAHPTAVVDPGCRIGPGTRLWHFTHVMADAVVGAGCVLGQNVFVGRGVRIGDRVKVQNNVSVYEGVTLEDEVFCGPSVVFTNVINPRSAVSRMHELRPTRIGRGATLGANSTILCGITIGSHAFVGAGAVVTRDVPSHALVVGNPARQIGWVCACGHKLVEHVRGPAAGARERSPEREHTCPACGARHRPVGHDLARVEPS